MPAQLQLTLVFLALAPVSVVTTGHFAKGGTGYNLLQYKLVDGVNKQILQKSVFHAVYFVSYEAYEWDPAKREAVTDGRTFQKSSLAAICQGQQAETCKKAVNEIWDMAKNGGSTDVPGDYAAVYMRCKDLKAAVGTDREVENCRG